MSEHVISSVTDRGMEGALDLAQNGSTAFLMALGRLVAESALAEVELDWWILDAIGPDQRTAQIVIAEMDFRKKMQLALTLTRHKGVSDKVLPKFTKHVGALQKLYNDRNDFVHGRWGSGSSAQKRRLYRAAARGEWKYRAIEVTSDDIDELANRFHAIAYRLNRLRDSLA